MVSRLDNDNRARGRSNYKKAYKASLKEQVAIESFLLARDGVKFERKAVPL